jgi:hypothetical protein
MIPVIINNRDLLTWPKAMVEKIKQLNGVGEIYIIDNFSTYKPLLEWYDTNPCHIIKTANLGHRAPWESGFIESLNAPHYIVTDSDLGIDTIPNNTIEILLEKLSIMSGLGKIGLKLDWESIPNTSPYYPHLQSYDKNRWKNSRIVDDVYIDVHVDTTFALYNRANYFVGGGSIEEPFIAKHYPWEFTEKTRSENEEFNYYIQHANNSSSYKVFLNL